MAGKLRNKKYEKNEAVLEDREIFLNLVTYYPRDEDKDWDEIKEAVKNYSGKKYFEQTILCLAKFLLENRGFGQTNDVICRIRKIYDCFSFNSFEQSIEICMPEYDTGYFLRAGNKRSVAYAMKLEKKEINYLPILILDYKNYFEPRDTYNLKGLDTIPGKIKCD